MPLTRSVVKSQRMGRGWGCTCSVPHYIALLWLLKHSNYTRKQKYKVTWQMIKRYFRHVSMICQVLFSHIVNQRGLLCGKLTKRPLLGFYHNQNHVSQISRLTYFCQYIRVSKLSDFYSTPYRTVFIRIRTKTRKNDKKSPQGRLKLSKKRSEML